MRYSDKCFQLETRLRRIRLILEKVYRKAGDDDDLFKFQAELAEAANAIGVVEKKVHADMYSKMRPAQILVTDQTKQVAAWIDEIMRAYKDHNDDNEDMLYSHICQMVETMDVSCSELARVRAEIIECSGEVIDKCSREMHELELKVISAMEGMTEVERKSSIVLYNPAESLMEEEE